MIFGTLLTRERTAVDHVRLGQEIHDLIGHKLSLMVLHASVLETEGGPAAERATVIRETGHAAIAGLRDILAALSDGVSSPSTERDVRASLLELVDQSRAAGLPVRTRIASGLDRLRPELAVALCCVVREALTNVHKHAGVVPTVVQVSVVSGLVVVVRNERSVARPAMACLGSGRGLVGLGARVSSCCGRLVHGSTCDGGFFVRASWDGGVL